MKIDRLVGSFFICFFMMNKNQRKIPIEQQEVIAEQLAGFFFDFWQKRDSKKYSNSRLKISKFNFTK